MSTIADTSRPSGLRSSRDTAEEVAIRRALRLGLFIWPAFFPLDAYMALVVVPGAPLRLFLFYRILFEGVLLLFWRLSRQPSADVRRLRLLNRTMAGGAALIISLMAIDLGGLTSPYVHGLSVVMLVMSVSIPSPWKRSLTWLIPTALMFPAVMAVAARALPELAASWRDGPRLALFGANYAFVLSVAVIGAIGGHQVWLAREQVYQARRLGRYRLKAPIGRGGMNEVWLAWDDALRRDVAIKILRAEDSVRRRGLEWFLREAHTLSRLASPHTVRVFDSGASDDGLYFIAMEYLVGADLQRLVRHLGPFAAARAVHIARQVCRSLAEAHDAGAVHRDIKPANVFLTQVGEERDFVKVVDFGMAKFFRHEADATQSMTIAGTPLYMAPELWRGHPADPRSDLYALGTMLYYLLTGAEPFAHRTTLHDVHRAHVEEAPQPPSRRRVGEIPDSLDQVVLKCLSKSPEQRYASAAEFSRALEECRDVGVWAAEDAARESARARIAGALWGAPSESETSRADTLAVETPAARTPGRR